MWAWSALIPALRRLIVSVWILGGRVRIRDGAAVVGHEFVGRIVGPDVVVGLWRVRDRRRTARRIIFVVGHVDERRIRVENKGAASVG